MKAVLKHELRSYCHSLSAYLFCAFLLLFVGVGAMLYNIESAVANFEYVLKFVCIGLTVIIPVLTMRVIAEEKKQKTDQLLYSLPLTTSQIVMGKYLAMLTVFLVPLCIVSIYPLIFAQYGDVYLLTAYGSLLAFFIMSAALIAAGMFISSLTDNQGFAAGISIALFLFNYFSVSLAENVSSTAFGVALAIAVLAFLLGMIVYYLTRSGNIAYAVGAGILAAALIILRFDSSGLEGLLPAVMKRLSLFERFYTFVNGIFDMTSIVFYLSVIVFFLLLTVQSLEKRRYN